MDENPKHIFETKWQKVKRYSCNTIITLVYLFIVAAIYNLMDFSIGESNPYIQASAAGIVTIIYYLIAFAFLAVIIKKVNSSLKRKHLTKNQIKNESIKLDSNQATTSSKDFSFESVVNNNHEATREENNSAPQVDFIKQEIDVPDRNSKGRRPSNVKTLKILTAVFASLFVITALILVFIKSPLCLFGHKYQAATCTNPQICSVCSATKGDPLGHSWQPATCTTPKTCEVCGATDGLPLEHQWVDATCTKPKTCEACGITAGSPLQHKWTWNNNIYDPVICEFCGEMQPKRIPDNGEIIFANILSESECKLTIHNQSKNCFVKLKDYNRNDILGFFVRSNQTATINVPEGECYIYFASGNDWYGKNYLFGEETQCSMDENLQTFEYDSDGYYWTATHLEYTLYEVPNGNFIPKTINMNEF